MLDSQLLRNDPHAVAKALLRRGFILDTDRFMRLEAQRSQQQTEQQSLQAQRNRLSKEVGQRKAAGEDVAELMKSMAGIGPRLKDVEATLGGAQAELRTLLAEIPNLPHTSVPAGSSEHDNVEIRRWGDPSQPVFEVKDHVDLGTQLGMMDFDAATKLTGSRFVVMFGALSTLHRALIQFMLDVHTREHAYRETYVPYLVNERSLFGTGQLPKFEEDQFLTTSDPSYYLIPTAEVPVTNLYRDVIVEPES
ncbi:MAG TPA: serine--tRNA ligase, partial [Gammaproteobacteria bacterium]|nr:serine--tRNA ligase [Gammaproteobacteria bacterium]